MAENNLDAQLQTEFDVILKPYTDRLDELEKSHQAKDTEIVLLSNAAENLVRQIDAYREKIKKLPKSKINR